MRNLAPRDSDSASFLTPAVKKKRKLYSTTPQTNAVSSSNAQQEECSSNAQQVEVRSLQGRGAATSFFSFAFVVINDKY